MTQTTVRNIAIFAGNDETLKVIMEAIENKELNANISLVVATKPWARTLGRAKAANIPTYALKSTSVEDIDDELAAELSNYEIDLIVLTGFYRKIGPKVLKEYTVISSHPSLLPKFGGKGMYGKNVHKAVIAARENLSGVTIHYVDDDFDTGKIIAQGKVAVYPADDYIGLSIRVQQMEEQIMLEVLKDFTES